ncbi:hypothetical protein XU18_0155 [Perkinsela sp. CCAP 1560/4]|nr:hypothetical protein XU18_0155 [Perkinsela sp. CCAP 1560/4]|eukprot:KNH09470.1 hypothetical protein XU18_0155 [Perkinsela sp. CCAP 1560/4]
MHRIAPLQPLIVWSKGSPLSLDIIKNAFEDKPEPATYPMSIRPRQRTALMVMQYGLYPVTSSDSTHRRLRQENLDYFQEPKPETLSEFHHHVEWRTGRNIDREEIRAAVIFSVRGLRAVAENSVDDKPLLTCLAKVSPSDTQMNDIDECGNVVYLTEQIRGQWHKVHDADHVMVEDMATSSSKDRKNIKLKTHFGHYVSKIGKLPLHAPVLECVFYHENRSLRDILHRISYTTGLQLQKNITWTTTNDAISTETHVCGTQRLNFIGMTKEAIQHACRSHSIFPVFIKPTTYKQRLESVSGGTQYTIALREIALRTPRGTGPQGMDAGKSIRQQAFDRLKSELKDRTEMLSKNGFVNYFPVHVIGGGGVSLCEMGAHLLRGDYCSVLRGHLQLEAERHPVSYDHYTQALGAPQDSLVARLEAWSLAMLAFRDCKEFRKFLQSMIRLLREGNRWEDMAKLLITSESFLDEHGSRYLIAFRAYVWNCMANRRLQRSYTDSSQSEKKFTVLPGDIVCLQTADEKKYHRVLDERDALGYSMADVVLPVIGDGDFSTLPGIRNDNTVRVDFPEHCEYTMLLEKLQIPSTVWGAENQRLTHSAGGSYFRPVVVKPQSMAWHLIRDPNSTVALKSDLFCLQEGNALLHSPFAYNQSENDEFISAVDEDMEHPEEALQVYKRIRTPSPLNQTPRFTKAMQYIQHVADNTLSMKYTPQSHPFKGVQRPRTVQMLPYRREDRCTLVLRFRLPSGSYAAMVLREICDVVYYKSFNEMF